MLSKLAEEKCQLKEQLEEANLKLQQQETKTDGEIGVSLIHIVNKTEHISVGRCFSFTCRWYR